MMQETVDPPGDVEAQIGVLAEAIFSRYNHDFRDYSPASLRRRVLYALTQFQVTTIGDLQERVLRSPEAFLRLLQFLTVPVSEMFRDPGYYRALREQVMPVLRTYPSIKVWIAGCSTGEEVYSMAILLREEGLLEKSIVYATDINPQSLDKARQGIFALESLKNYTANYQRSGGLRSLSDYYTAAYDGARFEHSLRDKITFADHSLATDSVFAETHLISCRNVLIYFNKRLQDRALGLFKESLCRRGFLGLGSKESLDFSSHAKGFEDVVRTERIFRKR
jgi:chemotaxis protein methyltransferase CheR